MQLINAVPLNCKSIIEHNCSSANLLLLNHHLIKKNNLISLDEPHCRELYNILVYTNPHKPTSQVYFDSLFREEELNWREICILPRKVSLDCNVRLFQYKGLNMFFMQTKSFLFLENCLLPYANKSMKQYFTFSKRSCYFLLYGIAHFYGHYLLL